MKYAILFMIAVLLILGGYILFNAKNNSAAPNTSGKSNNSPMFTDSSSETDIERMVIEAEDTVDIEAPFSKASVTDPIPPHPLTLKDASGAAALYLGPEKINYDKSISNNRKGHDKAKNPGLAQYLIKPAKNGKYNLWLRVYWVDDCADSVSLAIDNSPLMTIQSAQHAQWHWLPLRSVDNSPLKLDLSAGQEYKLTLCNREDDLFIDQIVLQPDGAAPPEGIIKPKPIVKQPQE